MSTAWDTNHYENFSLCYEILGISVNTTRKHVIHFCPTTKKKTFGKLYSGIKCKHSLEQKGQHYTTLKKKMLWWTCIFGSHADDQEPTNVGSVWIEPWGNEPGL